MAVFWCCCILFLATASGLTKARNIPIWNCFWEPAKSERHRMGCVKQYTVYVGAIATFGGGGLSLITIFRRGTGAPQLGSWAAEAAIIQAQWRNFRLVHGHITSILAVMCAAPVTLLPSFWRERHPDYYLMQARAALERVWLIIRGVFLLVSVLQMIGYVIEIEEDLFRGKASSLYMNESYSKPELYCEGCFLRWSTQTWSHLCLSISSLVFGAVLPSTARRQRVNAFIARMSQTPEEREATVIAMLVGRVGVHRVMRLAMDEFRVLEWSKLSEGDWDSSADSGLGDQTDRAQLGECDAFISHSWHDSGSQKWSALSVWAADFEKEHQRLPRIWLDKACIDQQNIEESLAALPLYLAGCNRLVVVAGPTYQDRLWCVLEVFTFLRMGGTLDRIDVLPVGKGTRAQIEDRFNTFDAQNAQCFVQADRQRLLGVIEAAFGDFKTFNLSVQNALITRGRTSGADRAWFARPEPPKDNDALTMPSLCEALPLQGSVVGLVRV